MGHGVDSEKQTLRVQKIKSCSVQDSAQAEQTQHLQHKIIPTNSTLYSKCKTMKLHAWARLGVGFIIINSWINALQVNN